MARTIIFLALSAVIFVGAIGTGWMYHEVSRTRELLVAAELNRSSPSPESLTAFRERAGSAKSGQAGELLAPAIIKKELVRARIKAESVSRKFEAAQIKLAKEHGARATAEKKIKSLEAKLLEERTAHQAMQRALRDVKTELTEQREETETARLKIRMISTELALERGRKLEKQGAPENTASEPPVQSETRVTAEHALKPAKAEVTATDVKEVTGEVTGPATPEPEPQAETIANDELAANSRRSIVQTVQLELKRVGCYQGQTDGVWNDDSRHALWKFVKHTKHKLSSPIPPKTAIKALKATSGTVCQ